MASVYVSITGLRIKAFWHLPTFWHYAVPAMIQAKAEEGCLQADARTINGVKHTRTAWVDEAAMRAFLYKGAHLDAIRAFRKIATGKTFGAEMQDIPDWPTVHQMWRDRGRDY